MMGKQKRGVKSSNDADDLATLTDDNLSACLRNRYDTSRIYTLLGSSRLVAVNPYKPLSINDDNVGLEYVAAYKDLQQQQPRPQPHLFDLVNRAYFYMRRTGTDQAMVISGQSGSGKTQIRNLIIRHLVRLSSHKKESKTQTQLVHSQKVLDAFGSAATALSNEASRYGYYAEVQFSERGRMVGAKTIHYCLEKSRLTAASPREGNFSVLYQLVAGATPEERSALHLQSQQIEQYNYLAKYKRPITPADAEDFTELKAALKLAGFRRDHTTRIVQLLAAILHLGNLVFVDPEGSQNNQDAAYVKNTDILDLVADFLGVDPRALENVLVFKTTMIRKDVTTLILNAEQARLQRDELAKTLYSLLFAWMVERINDKLCVEDNKFSSFIGVLDLPGPHYTDEANRFHSFIVNVATERIQSFLATQLFSEAELSAYDNEGIAMPRVTSGYQAADVLDLLYRPSRGVCTIINDMSENAQKRQLTDADMVDSLVKYNGNNALFSTKTAPGSQQRLFTIQHFGAPVTYDPNGFLADNSDQVAVDFVSLFRGGAGMPSSWNAFLVDIWGKYLQTESHPRNEAAVVSAHQKPTRSPSVRQSQRKKKTEGAGGNASEDPSKKAGILAQVQKSLDDLTATFQEAKLWTVYCIRPNDSQSSTQFDTRIVDAQIRGYGLLDIARKVQIEYAISYTHQEFLDRYAVPLQSMAPGVDRSGRLPRAQMEAIAEQLGMDSTMMAVGTTKVFLADSTWRLLEDRLRAMEKDEQRRNRDASKAAALAAGPPIEEEDEEMMGRDASHDPEESLLQRHMTGSSRNASPTELHAMTAASAGLPPPPSRYHSQMMDEQRSFYSEDEYYYNDGMSSSRYHDNDDSVYGSESYINTQDTDPKGMMLGHPAMNEKENLNATEEDESSQTPGRKRWLFLVWALTWWIPTPFLVWCGRMKRKDVRIAWREKVALCIIILLLCAFVIWFLVFFGELVCPHQAVFSDSELQSHSEKDDAYVAIRGEVFDLTSFAPRHYVSGVIPTDSVLEYGGTDATDLFPVQVSALCQGVTGSVDPSVPLTFAFNNTDDNAKYHDFTYSSYPYQPDWYYQQMTLLRKQYKVGNMGYEPHEVYVQATEGTTVSGIKTNRQWAIIDNHIYDLTLYNMGGRTPMAPPGETPPSDVDVNYMDSSIVQLFREKSGLDITEDFNSLPLDSAVKERQLVCLRNLFFVGLVDTRNSARCQFSTYLLLIITCLLCAVMVFKFLAAFRLGSARAPEELDKFVICQVTCYTEDEESLRKTIDSIATLRYDDKRKLLFVICDGMIVGSGNDRPTPRIVLDILGVDPQVDPEPLSFQSVGEGQKQHNMGKIYSGLYEVSGHVVPYLVVVKCGKPTERQKPGNRGKRDSQLILMQFLNRVHFDAPMSPLQLEMYHQMKNVIGVSPSMYDFVLMVDADTEVMPDGLNNLVSSMAHDSKIIGICGETTLANEKATWATMIQVYEYFISHHMTKAFESLFSTVTCLPGCFTMYRIRTVDGKRALFCSNEIIEEYAVNKVDTLHKKNLLHLGEDRYLTTLLLKHFPTFKTKFTPDAKCQTNVPDTWNVLVSQRRRWINSTIHNLGELAFLPRLCGFCCFSMRFVVMLDLISTLVMPAIVGYLGYLIYKLSTLENQVPILTIIVIAGTYGLQALLFIVKRRWEYILWMLVSILAIPVFWFYIPIYAYWHFDDFSWGNTRIVVGEKGKKTTVADEGEFDPKSIPLMTWSQYEKMLLAEDYWDDNMSQGSSRSSYTHRSRMRAGTPMLGGSGAVGGGAESVYGGGGGGDNMSMYTHSMMLNPQPQHPRASQASFFPDSGSMMMPSSASIPMMPYPSQQLNTPAGRSSMASFGPDAYLNQQRQSSRPSLMPSSSSFVMPPPPASVQNDGSSQSLLMEEFSSTQGPTNEEILAEVKRILSTADLTKVTKKQVREELSAIFGVSMASRKDYINACIENVLQGRM